MSAGDFPQFNSCHTSRYGVQSVSDDLRNKFITLTKRLCGNYVFPVPVSIHIVNAEKAAVSSGQRTYGVIRWYTDRIPGIEVAAAYEKDKLEKYSRDDIDEMILSSLIHEMTLFQCCSGTVQSEASSERQADYYRYRILEKLMSELY